MAKKIDAANQGHSYLNSLLGQREIVPLGTEEIIKAEPVKEEIKKEESMLSAPAAYHAPSVSYEPVQENIPNPVIERNRPGRKRAGLEPKTRGSFAIDPLAFTNLKKVAYIRHEKISNIIEDYIIRYVDLHKEDIEEFDRLPEAIKARADI